VDQNIPCPQTIQIVWHQLNSECHGKLVAQRRCKHNIFGSEKFADRSHYNVFCVSDIIFLMSAIVDLFYIMCFFCMNSHLIWTSCNHYCIYVRLL